MHRRLFAIPLGLLALLLLIIVVAASSGDPASAPASSQRLESAPTASASRRPAAAPTATQGPAAPPMTGTAAALLAAFEGTSALTSLEAEMKMSSTMPSGFEPGTDLDMTNHTVLIITEAGIQQHVVTSMPMGPDTMDVIILGTTGYISSTRFTGGGSADSPSAPPAAEWQILPAEQTAAMDVSELWPKMLSQVLDPGHDLPLLSLEGQEELHGISCDRYFTDQASLPWAQGMQNTGMIFTQQHLTVWHCADGHLRRITSDALLASPSDSTITSSATLSLDLLATSTTYTIIAPADAKPMQR